MSNKWTTAEDAKLIYNAGRVSVNRMADDLGRSSQSINDRCGRLNIRWYRDSYSIVSVARETGWDKETVKRAVGVLFENSSIRKVGKGNGTRYLLTWSQCDRLVKVLQRRHNREWTSVEDEQLLGMRAKNYLYKVIAYKLRRSVSACKQRKMKLCHMLRG